MDDNGELVSPVQIGLKRKQRAFLRAEGKRLDLSRSALVRKLIDEAVASREVEEGVVENE